MSTGKEVICRMTNAGSSDRKEIPFSWYLMLTIILITVPIVAFVSLMDYREVEQDLIGDHIIRQEQTEKSTIEAMKLIDAGLKLYDLTLDHKMENGFALLLEEYERSGRDPAMMDFPAVREELGEDMDIYIINADGVIEYTTYEPEIGLDFSAYPDFYAYITDLRLGNTFSADRIVQEITTKEMRKYAYMPTPDHRYLLELGLKASEFSQYRQGFAYRQAVNELMALDPDIRGIRIFNEFGVQVNATQEMVSLDDPQTHDYITAVFATENDATIIDTERETETRYIYVNLTDLDYASDMSGVVEMTYTTAPLRDELENTRLKHCLFALVAILLTCCITFPVANRITRPVRRIADDVDTIALGNLDHTISVTGGAEFVRLERSITTMVDTLKDHIQQLENSERQIQEYSEHLEKDVKDRKADLEASNQEANLYLDILIHDINNANTITVGYAALLAEVLEGDRREHAEKILQRLQMSREIIERVATIRKAQDEAAQLKPVDLDSTIKMQIAGHPAANIRYEPHAVTVFADELLPEIFTNLIGNAIRYGGPDVAITITVEEQGDEVIISVEDTGPGITDKLKEDTFTGSKAGKESRKRKGLGLYICQMLTERYGGRIWIDDRVPGDPTQGAAIRFTLKKTAGNTPSHR